jgi:N utilization substance protein B
MSTGGGRAPNPAHARRRARRLAVQALYQWQLSDQSVGAIDEQFMEEQDMQRADVQYFRELLHKVPARLDELDAELARWIDRPIGEVDPVERAILRIALYELKFRIDIPYRIVLSEAVGLAKTFGAAEGHKYVNGVLDQAARALRPVEIAGGRR